MNCISNRKVLIYFLTASAALAVFIFWFDSRMIKPHSIIPPQLVDDALIITQALDDYRIEKSICPSSVEVLAEWMAEHPKWRYEDFGKIRFSVHSRVAPLRVSWVLGEAPGCMHFCYLELFNLNSALMRPSLEKADYLVAGTRNDRSHFIAFIDRNRFSALVVHGDDLFTAEDFYKGLGVRFKSPKISQQKIIDSLFVGSAEQVRVFNEIQNSDDP